MKMVKISELFDTEIIFENRGLFSYYENENDDENPPFPNLTDFITSDNSLELDIDYFIGFSGDKYFSPLMMKLIKVVCDSYGVDYNKFLLGTLSITEKRTIITELNDFCHFGSLIYNRFSSKWKHIYDALNLTYNPLENYNMEQVRTPDLSKGTTGTSSTESESQSEIYGYNSEEPNDSTAIKGKQSSSIGNTETETGTDTLTRSGNIGVTTSQQMLESELKVRLYDFYKEIYKDIDSIMCLKIY